MQALITTIIHRPYVFAFFMTFLILGWLNRGAARTLLFLILGFLIAFLSEVSSIRNGFPYGMYHYVYENLQGELLLWRVPLWDSLSYTFLAYASYETAAFFLGSSRLLPLYSSLLMVLLDIVADPLAVRGDRWFLGRIFYYPEGGVYFGVPLSNFGGWFLVALTIFSGYHFLERKLFKRQPPLKKPILGPLFYWGIASFNLLITFAIGEKALGFTGLGMHLFCLSTLIWFKTKK